MFYLRKIQHLPSLSSFFFKCAYLYNRRLNALPTKMIDI